MTELCSRGPLSAELLSALLPGYQYKALVLAACGQVGTVLGYSAPFVGAFSDQLSDRWAKRLGGRRRPFIIVGTIIGTISCYMTYNAVYRRPLTKWVYAELLFSMILGSIGGCISVPPFSAIIPETIPVRQRGLCITIQSWFNTLINIGGNTIGYMVGEGLFLTIDQVWWINIIHGPIMLPFVLLMANSRAFNQCSASGIWKPEKPISLAVKNRYARRARDAELREFSTGKKRGLVRLASKCLRSTRSLTTDCMYRSNARWMNCAISPLLLLILAFVIFGF
eukprot:SAG31_NODE_7427_length_1691_cov_1.337312_2_plen_280_part_01